MNFARTGIVAAFLPILATSCTAPAPTLSSVQVGELAKEIVTHTPENHHWTYGPCFSWVLVTADASDSVPAVTEQVRALLSQRYIVYFTEGEVPAEYRRHGDMGPYYDSGFDFSFKIRLLGRNRVEVTYSDYEGPLAGSHQLIQYRWKRSRWVVSSSGPFVVS